MRLISRNIKLTLYCIVISFMMGSLIGCDSTNSNKKNELVKTEENNFIYGNSENENFYEITQLPFPTFWGGEAYSIITPEGDLYLIDGGFQGEDGQRIAQYIEEHGGKVKAWILTHPHVDHIGAFLDYMVSNADKVEKVYYSPFTKEFFEEEEDPEIYEVLNNPNAILFYQFLEIMEITNEEVEYIPMIVGDQLSIGDLQLECFASFSPDRHDVNANSLVFTISYDDFVLLLTSDMTELTLKDMEEELSKEALCWTADMIQIPHHGYMAGIGSDALYLATKPEYALLDCTVQEFENNSVNIQGHVAMVENLEIEVLKRFDDSDGNKITVYVP
ncbi:MAG: MBL fold metallo-hydrolase [Lachnospiraceae bacterium]|nr:MBL fold metallo-hydrolase [Lachnospiraceae bacterium]